MELNQSKKRREPKSAGSWMIPVSSFKDQMGAAPPVATPAPVQQALPPLPSSVPTQQALPPQVPTHPFPPQMPPMPSSGGNFDILSTTIATLNTNPYLIGVLMLLLNLGGRFLSLELTKKQEEFLQQAWLRPLLFFTVIFVATRNLAVAFWITLLLFFVIWVLANEKSPFCLIPSWKEKDPNQTVNKQELYEQNMSYLEKKG